MVKAHGYDATTSGDAVCKSDDTAPDSINYRVIFFTCFVGLAMVGEGYDIGVINGAAVRIRDDLGLSTWHLSLVVMMTPLCFMPGSLLGGAAADVLGRRVGLMICCAFLILGPLGMAMSSSFIHLLVTRALVGCGVGMGYVVVSMYIAEVAPTGMRGRLTIMEEVFLTIGILAGYLMNWYLYGIKDDWRWMLGLGVILPFFVLLVLCTPLVHESPRWLFMKGRTEEAEKVLNIYVGREEAQRAMKAMQSESSDQDFATWQDLLSQAKEKEVRRMLLAGLTVGCAQMLCGYLPMVYYSSTVLKTVMSERAAFMGTVAMGIVKLTVVLFVLGIIERAGRRSMLLWSIGVCGFACVWLAIAFMVEASGLVKILGFMFFMAGFSIGLGPLTFVYIPEVFTTKWRAKGMACSLFVSRIFGVASTLAFPLLVDSAGVSTSFWVLTALNVLVFGLSWTYAFETGGSSLEGIAKLQVQASKNLA